MEARIHLDQGTVLYGIILLIDGIKTLLYIIGTDVCKESQATHIDTQNRDHLLSDATRSFQERTVASHGDDDVCIKIIISENLRCIHIELLILCQELPTLLPLSETNRRALSE